MSVSFFVIIPNLLIKVTLGALAQHLPVLLWFGVGVRVMVRVVLSSETGLGLILLLGDPLGPVSLLLFLL